MTTKDTLDVPLNTGFLNSQVATYKARMDRLCEENSRLVKENYLLNNLVWETKHHYRRVIIFLRLITLIAAVMVAMNVLIVIKGHL